MYCPKCGKENPDNAKLCQSCSWVLSSIAATAPNPNAQTSGLAITSLVLGILSLFTFFITALPAIICGIISLVKIEKSKGTLKGKGLAIAGIVTPGVMLPLFALLLGILMPALAKTRTIAYRMVCGANISGLGKAMIIYADDFNDTYPDSSKWCDLLVKYVDVTEKSFHCPGNSSKGSCDYAMNKNIEKIGTMAPPDIVLLFESTPGWNQSGGPELLTTKNHKGEGCNILFNGGHVAFIQTEDINDLKW